MPRDPLSHVIARYGRAAKTAPTDVSRLLARNLRSRYRICCPHVGHQPDLVLLKHREDFYAADHPGPRDVLLLIEVAESSAQFDREQKLRLYAQAGVPEYWVFDLAQNRLIVHRDPVGQEYASVQEHDRSARVSPQPFPEQVLELGDLLSR